MINAHFTRWAFATLAAGAMEYASWAATFTYQSKDLVLGLRQSGGSAEMVVDLGSVVALHQLAPGATITFSQFNSNQLSRAFGSLDGVGWAVLGTAPPGLADTNYPDATLWVTRPRSALNTQSLPWVRKSYYNQASPSTRIDSIGQKAHVYGSDNPTDPVKNTATAVIIPAGDTFAYSNFMGPAGNLQNTFLGDAENVVGDSFAENTSPARSDLYEMLPATGTNINTGGAYLGYFELSPSGKLTFTAAGGSPTLTPPTLAISRAGTQITLSFATVSGATYWVGVTNAAGLLAPRSSWPKLGAAITGSGATQSVTDSVSDAQRFYILQAGQ